MNSLDKFSLKYFWYIKKKQLKTIPRKKKVGGPKMKIKKKEAKIEIIYIP